MKITAVAGVGMNWTAPAKWSLKLFQVKVCQSCSGLRCVVLGCLDQTGQIVSALDKVDINKADVDNQFQLWVKLICAKEGQGFLAFGRLLSFPEKFSN